MILGIPIHSLPFRAWLIGFITAVVFALLALIAIKLKCFTIEPYDKEEKDDE